jgi:hypothetical protein
VAVVEEVAVVVREVERAAVVAAVLLDSPQTQSRY